MNVIDRIDCLIKNFGNLIDQYGEDTPITLGQLQQIFFDLRSEQLNKQIESTVQQAGKTFEQIRNEPLCNIVPTSFFVTEAEAKEMKEKLTPESYRLWSSKHFICHGTIGGAIAEFRRTFNEQHPGERLNDWLRQNYPPDKPAEKI